MSTQEAFEAAVNLIRSMPKEGIESFILIQDGFVYPLPRCPTFHPKVNGVIFWPEGMEKLGGHRDEKLLKFPSLFFSVQLVILAPIHIDPPCCYLS